MKPFVPVYVPVGVPTFHMESAQDAFERSAAALKAMDGDFVCPQEKLLSLDALRAYLDPLAPDLVVFQNLTFANAAYMAEVLRRTSCPVVLWTLREPVIDGGRLRLNSLTGAYSAANALRAFGNRPFSYVFGAPEEPRVIDAVSAFTSAARIKKAMSGLRMAAVGHTPQGFGFGRALDSELMHVFGVDLESVEARELIDRAKGYSDEECSEYLERTACATCGLEKTPEANRLAHARLYRAYSEYVEERGIGALASRCWPDFFTAYGTPVCAVLAMLNDLGVPAACETDTYGALSMFVAAEMTGKPAFFGDPVALHKDENSVTFWHCGTAACSLAREDTGACAGVHCNRKIGPTLEFGCKPEKEVTVLRIGRDGDGNFRILTARGEALDKPKQYYGTSVVVKLEHDAEDFVRKSVEYGWEPHFAVAMGDISEAVADLGKFLGIEVFGF